MICLILRYSEFFQNPLTQNDKSSPLINSFTKKTLFSSTNLKFSVKQSKITKKRIRVEVWRFSVQ